MPELISFVRFDDDERDVLIRALQGHGRLLEVAGKKPGEVRAPIAGHLNRVREHNDPYGLEDLNHLDETFQAMVDVWTPQTEAAWWRDAGAPGGDDAIEGLARERQLAIGRVRAARVIVARARRMAGNGRLTPPSMAKILTSFLDRYQADSETEWVVKAAGPDFVEVAIFDGGAPGLYRVFAHHHEIVQAFGS